MELPRVQRGQAGGVAREVERVLEQHGDRHRADAARHGRDRARVLLRRLEVHVATQLVPLGGLGRRLRVHADVDDDRARLDPLSKNHLSRADGGDHDVRASDVPREVFRPRVAHGHGSIHGLQQVRYRHADDVRTADDDAILAADLDLGALQQLDAPRRRAGQRQGRLPALQAHVADVVRRESVGVLLNEDRLEHRCLVDVLRQRQLHEDPVHLRVRVQVAHTLEQLLLCDTLVERLVHRVEGHLRCGLLLHANVRRRVRSGTDKHHRQPRRDAVLLLQLGSVLLDLSANFRRDSLAIDDRCPVACHARRRR
mmetsp:Transcript_33026/g.84170  ORF Transcript_33026/g.84170 Transcript_33026/m.84170 type:complete len:312 (+) Transcript_33026:187-1122(+)